MRRIVAGLAALMAVVSGLLGLLGLGASLSPASASPVRASAEPSQSAYDLVASDGGIFSFGGAPFDGSTGGMTLNKPIVGMAAAPDGKGYWLVASDGGLFSFGDAQFYGSTGSLALNKPIVGMAAAPDGKGYWLVASDGGIFSFGGAPFDGSTGGMTLNKPIVGMAATPDGKGYWLVASDGGIFSFGDAQFYGSTGSLALNKPIVGMAATPDGKGYWLVASDGGIFSFGDAQFYGSTGSLALNKPIVGMAATPDGKGYWLVASDGGIFSFGDAQFYGSTGSLALNKPIVGMAAVPASAPVSGVGLFAHLDPSFVQNPTNPLDVTYSYSASATETEGGQTTPDSSLPSGILDLYSDGSLACSMNVGGSITGGTCEVVYAATGQHLVTVEYFSGSEDVTDTETELVEPYTTTTSISSVGDPSTGTTTDISAVITTSAGSVLSPPPGAVTFTLDNTGTLTTKSGGQTSCSIAWTGITYTGIAWRATGATSSNCVMGGYWPFPMQASMTAAATYFGTTGISGSSSASQALPWSGPAPNGNTTTTLTVNETGASPNWTFVVGADVENMTASGSVSPAAGALTFSFNGVTALTTEAPGQTSCTVSFAYAGTYAGNPSDEAASYDVASSDCAFGPGYGSPVAVFSVDNGSANTGTSTYQDHISATFTQNGYETSADVQPFSLVW